MAIPQVRVLFIKPGTAAADSYPGKVIIPKSVKTDQVIMKEN